QELSGAEHEERGGQALPDERGDVDPAHEGEAPVTLEHGRDPADVAHGDGVVEAELGAEVRADLGWNVGIGGELLERIAGSQCQDREEDQADTEEGRDRDEESSEEVLGHRRGGRRMSKYL